MMRNILLVFFCSISSLTFVSAQRQLWGTVSLGGANDDGFIFMTDSTGDNLEIIHEFKVEVDGENVSALTLASNHKLYGMTAAGGQVGGSDVYAGGTFFEYDLTTSTFKVLQHFGVSNQALPGIVIPVGDGQPALTEVSPGILYGLMRQGSYVFAYNINTGVFTQPFTMPLYQGGAANGPLQNKLNRAFIKAANGNFYATTATNSVCPIANPYMGSIMRLNAAGTTLTIPHRASCLGEEGYSYKGSLAELNGKFYGITGYGGAYSKGVIFEYNIAANTYTKRHDFTNSSFSYEPTALVVGPNGKLYGTAHGGGIPEPPIGLPAGGGVLFEFDPVTSAFEVKHSFTLAGQSVYDMGVFPSGLVKGLNGKLYGATQYGVFEYNTSTGTIRTAGRFNTFGFAPSLIPVCRKPAYQYREQSTFTVCDGQPFIMDLQTPNAASSAWQHNGTADLVQQTAILDFSSFEAADAGTWICTLTNECGATVTQTITLVLGDPPQPSIQTTGPTEFCEGESVTLAAQTGYDSYAWSSGQTDRVIVVTESGSYSVIANNGCASPASVPVEITVNPLPATPEITQVTENGVVLIASGNESDLYDWTFNDELLDVHADRIIDAQEGTYTARSVSDAGCRSAEAATATVIITGIEADIHEQFLAYPNPASGVLHISLKEGSPSIATRVRLYDMTGKIVSSDQLMLTTHESSLELRAIPSGLYVLRISHSSGEVVKKIQIMK